ncbi:MAG: hypothetical protein NWS40_03265 [Crocinitomicaceae bacterium]|jgi:hypothetical protein|nr:hypothetical protein [Crocinitomicaceae bacterium]MDP4683689.1 hypothetical protein [Crocinitomicaceae bacterium]MDP4866946.1 hypothetical protein [Crocinitomicaceae bacterium]MDP5012021.1 hypothetical protein [Crocinitomicaceae bacterium]
MKFLRIVLIILLMLSIGAFGYSLYQFVLNSSILTHLLILIGSLLSGITFFALLISKDKGMSAIIWFCLAIANLLIFVIDYNQPAFLKQSYGVSLAIIFALLVYSIQKMQEHYHKPYSKQLRFLNFGSIILVVSMMVLKIDNRMIWDVLSYLIATVIIINLILFLLPTALHQSKNEPKP